MIDPNENLRKQRLIQSRIDRGEATPKELTHLADLAKQMDEYLSRGGYLPSEWDKGGLR